MATGEVDLLGEPRLKNGLTYYPGVQTEKGSVILGNVVRLQLQAEGAQPYIGYGFLKGLWLWRDQPYIRVQYMAPSSLDLPKDAIAYRSEADANSMAELMVTNRVGDLHLNALLGPVFIEGGPLLSQLFQENVGADSDGFICSRHLDPAVQRVQPLDEAFRLTPIVQAFPKTVLRAILGAPAEDGAGGLRVPQCAAAPTSAMALGAPPPSAAAAASPPRPPSQRTGGAPVAAGALPPRAANGEASGALIPGLSEPPAGDDSASAIMAAVAPSPPAGSCMQQSAPTRVGGGGGSGFSAAPMVSYDAEAAANGAVRVSASKGLGPAERRNAILLQATYNGVLFRPSMVVRCPAEKRVLLERLASIFGLVNGSVKVVYQQAPGVWVELGAVSEMVTALEEQAELNAMPVHVSGEEQLHLPLLHALVCAIAIAQIVALSAFLYYVVYVPQLPAPWSFMIYLPLLLLGYHGYAALTCLTEEYLISQAMRVAFSRKDGWLVSLMLTSLLGPDATVLFCRLQLPPLGASLSKATEQLLVFWGFGLHLVLDAPALAINVLLHRRLDLEWDLYSKVLLATTAASLSINFIWHIVRMWTVRPEEEMELGGLNFGRGSNSIGTTPTKRRTLRKLDTSKYVGLNNPPIGNMGGGALYEA